MVVLRKKVSLFGRQNIHIVILILIFFVVQPLIISCDHNNRQYKLVSNPNADNNSTKAYPRVVRFDFQDGSWIKIARISIRWFYSYKEITVVYDSNSIWYEGPEKLGQKVVRHKMWADIYNSATKNKELINQLITDDYNDILEISKCNSIEEVVKLLNKYEIRQI